MDEFMIHLNAWTGHVQLGRDLVLDGIRRLEDVDHACKDFVGQVTAPNHVEVEPIPDDIQSQKETST
jgi:hypothetical protein